MRAKKHLGQNFLKSKTVVHTMVSTADITSADTVLEIGPGKGVLTETLLETGAKVIAIEMDSELIPLLTQKFQKEIESKQFTLIEGDALKVLTKEKCRNFGSYKLVANIPYYVTGEIIKKFLTSEYQPTSMTLLVQKEVAQRIVDTKESILSLSVKAYGTPKYIQKVPARYFTPSPKVDSAVLYIDSISKEIFTQNNITEEAFFTIVRAGFAQKRKKLINNLQKNTSKKILEGIFENINIANDSRAEELTLTMWITLIKELNP